MSARPKQPGGSAAGPGRPLRVGLTGNIAAGKSTVARLLQELGASVIDADALARQVTLPGSAVLQAIGRVLGPEVIDDQGALDRARLARLVFSQPEARRRLEEITHPAIAQAFEVEAARLAQAGAILIIYEAALLVEADRHRQLDRLVVVAAGQKVRAARLTARNGLSRAEAEQRLAAQLPQERKLALADYVIDNSGSLEETRQQVRHLFSQLQRLAVGLQEEP